MEHLSEKLHHNAVYVHWHGSMALTAITNTFPSTAAACLIYGRNNRYQFCPSERMQCCCPVPVSALVCYKASQKNSIIWQWPDRRLQTLSSPFRIAASRSWGHHQCMPPDVQREKRFDMLQVNQIKMVLKYMWSKGCQYHIGHFRRCRTAEPQRSHVSIRGVGSVVLRGLASRTLALSSVLSRRMSLAQFLDR